MKYYKWMFENSVSVTRVHGFVFTSIEDATKYSKDFENWCYGNGESKNLYTFNGVEPFLIKQMLTSHFGHRTPPYDDMKLSDSDVNRGLDYFNSKPEDYFWTRRGFEDIALMVNIGRRIGCIMPSSKSRSHVQNVEALYCQPITMHKVLPDELIASQVNDI